MRSTLIDDPDLRSFLPSFVADLPSLVSKLQTLVGCENVQELRAVVHQLKGTGGFYGFMPLTEGAERIEGRIDARQTLQAIADEVHTLVQTIRSVEGYEPSKERGGAAAKNPSFEMGSNGGAS